MFDRLREELDAEYGARYDYLQEAYGATALDAAKFAEDEERYYDDLLLAGNIPVVEPAKPGQIDLPFLF